MDDMAQRIVDKALELGYEKCGIIKVGDMAGYGEKLGERMARVPMGRMQFGRFRGFASPAKNFPWAKSVVALASSYAGYDVPPALEGMYGKAYLFDGRLDENSRDFAMRRQFAAFLEGEGLKVAAEPKFGVTALRWAAAKAGLGLMRRNNFFYTENGSWCFLEAWLIDRELEHIEEIDGAALPPCPKGCDKCARACPTGALSAPYTLSMFKCVSFLNTMAANIFPFPPGARTRAQTGCWLYGCDACQDACPANAGKWRGGEAFPGLAELAENLSPERVAVMTPDEIAGMLSPKFWYIEPKNLWRWKISALTVMGNGNRKEYRAAIRAATADPDRRVRAFARKIEKRLPE